MSLLSVRLRKKSIRAIVPIVRSRLGVKKVTVSATDVNDRGLRSLKLQQKIGRVSSLEVELRHLRYTDRWE